MPRRACRRRRASISAAPTESSICWAQNLSIFKQIAQGLDDETWMHHLRAADYSKWFRTAIKDKDLAMEAAAIEETRALSAAESRRRIIEAVERKYTAPARSATGERQVLDGAAGLGSREADLSAPPGSSLA